MSGARTKSEKRVAVSYLRQKEWEVWVLRFNRGSKKEKPVKFIASREWKTPGSPCLWAGTRGGFASERAAQEFLETQLASDGGQVHEFNLSVINCLAGAGYEPSNSRLLPDALGAQLRRAHRAAKPER
jgi:hypothetical protein